MNGLPDGMTGASVADLGGLKGFTADPNEQAQAQQQTQQKAGILKQILHPDALQRLGRVKLVKQAKVEALEMKLIQMAMRGEIQRQLTDEVIVNMLEEAGAEQKAKKVVLARKALDSDSDNDDDLW
jgi:programmed cell death protein 5